MIFSHYILHAVLGVDKKKIFELQIFPNMNS